MQIQEKTGEIYFWGGLVVTLLLWYLAGTNTYELIMIINDHTEGANTESAVLGKSFGLSLVFSLLAYRVGKWYMPILTVNIPQQETADLDIAEKKPKGDLAIYSEWQWRRLLPKPTGFVSGGHEFYNSGRNTLDKAILEFYQGGSSLLVQEVLDETNVQLEKLTNLDLTGTKYSNHAHYLRNDYEKLENALSLVIKSIEPESDNEKRLAILTANDDELTKYEVMSIENDGSRDPIYLQKRLKDDPRIFDDSYTSGRQYTTGGYSDEHPEVCTFSFKCLKTDLVDLKTICQKK